MMKPLALIAALLLATPVVAEVRDCSFFDNMIQAAADANQHGIWRFPHGILMGRYMLDWFEENPHHLAILKEEQKECGLPIWSIEMWLPEVPRK